MGPRPDGQAIVAAAERLVIVVGGYGSGKTEIAVNLAVREARAGRRVQIADLDIVNPYFRCREAREPMERRGIRVVVPPGAQAWADLPIVLPEVLGMLAPTEDTLSILDVGGDDVGARVLASLRGRISCCAMWQVINGQRPFTGTTDGCLRMRDEIERASRLSVTGLVANSHLTTDTTPAVVLDGLGLALDVGKTAGLPVRCIGIIDGLAKAPEFAGLGVPVLRLQRLMLPPWIPTAAARQTAPGECDGQNHG